MDRAALATIGRPPGRSRILPSRLTWQRAPGVWRVEPRPACLAVSVCDDRGVVDGARGGRAAMRQLADLRRRLVVAEDALADALAAMKRAEEAFGAANDRFAAAESALEGARGPGPGAAGVVRR